LLKAEYATTLWKFRESNGWLAVLAMTEFSSNYIVEHTKTFAVAFMALFPVVNPIGDAPIFLALTRWYPETTRNILSRKIAAYGFVLLAGSFLFGTLILDFFGISLVVVRLAGGLVVAATGWGLLNQKDDPKSAAGQANTETLDDAMEHAFYPLTLPITVGPGCISIAITLGARLRNQGGPLLEKGFATSLFAMLVICVMVFYCYSNADRLVRVLGKSGTTVMTRLSAFILLAIGVQIIWTGLQQGIPQLLPQLSCR
jgi:multiple antibiotic resistance protein